MAHQVELKRQTIEDDSSITIDIEQLLNKFADKIMKSNRIDLVKSVEYAEIFRVIDDSEQILKLTKVKER
jgi:hypothetical protein